MTWEDDIQLAEKAIPFQNNIYRQLFDLFNINRFKREDNLILDRQYHIDVELTLANGIKLLGQEKALRYRYAKFNTFTIEFYQNRFTKEQGEFFNLGAQFYLHSYWDEIESGFIKWYFIKIFDFLTDLKKQPVEVLERRTKPATTSRASFYYLNYNNIPTNFIYSFNDEQRPISFDDLLLKQEDADAQRR